MRKVSCLCPTFGRFPQFGRLLAEAVWCFLQQDYPNKELVILNDCAPQRIVCNAPGVVVINLQNRFPTLGEKYNALVRCSSGDLLLPWEDDDLSLPWRIRQSVERIGTNAYWNPQRSWYCNAGVLHSDHAHGVCHNASAFVHSAWWGVGGYPATNGDQDAIFDSRLRRWSVAEPLGEDTREWSYVYRWGVSPLHLSGAADMNALYAAAGKLPIEAGTFEIRVEEGAQVSGSPCYPLPRSV